MKNTPQKKSQLLTPRGVLSMLIVLLYAAGLILMIAGSFTSGASMWAVSTIAGALVLYVKHRQEKRAADEAEVAEEERRYQENLRKAKEGEQD